MRHGWLYRAAATRRHVRSRQRVFQRLRCDWPSIADGTHWTVSESGRLRKYTQSCDRHAICRYDRWVSRFRRHRQTFYRRLDQTEAR